MEYNVILTRSADKKLLRLEKTIRVRIADAFDELAKDPTNGSRKLKVPYSGYRLRVGDYRTLCTVEKRDVTIYEIAHRKDVYRQ